MKIEQKDHGYTQEQVKEKWNNIIIKAVTFLK